MNTTNLTQLLVDQAIEEIIKTMSVYIPVMDGLGTNNMLSKPHTIKSKYRHIINMDEDRKAKLANIIGKDIKLGKLSLEQIKVEVLPMMIQFNESQLSDVKGLTSASSEIISNLNKQYDTLLAETLLKSKKTVINTEVDGADGLNIAKTILSLARRVLTAQSNTEGGSAIRIVASSNLMEAMAFPTASTQTNAPSDFLMKGLVGLGISESNISFQWTLKDSELYVANSNLVDIYTYGSAQLFNAGTNQEGLYDYAQFLFSTPYVWIAEDNVLQYQSFKNVA